MRHLAALSPHLEPEFVGAPKHLGKQRIPPTQRRSLAAAACGALVERAGHLLDVQLDEGGEARVV